VNIKQWARLESDRLAGWVSVAVGLLALLLGWIGTSGSKYAAQQLPYILTGGIGGVFGLGLGATLLLSADLRDEWRKLDKIHEELRHVREHADATSTGTPVAPIPDLPDQPVEAAVASNGRGSGNRRAAGSRPRKAP
jgi:hypothetical protein